MKKKVITISAIIAGAIILGLFFLWVLLPRIMLYKIVNNYLPSLDKSAEYFSEFSAVSGDNVIIIDNGAVSVKIPDRFKPAPKEMLPSLHVDSETKESVFFQLNNHDSEELNLLDPEKFKDKEGVPEDFDLKEITEGFESLGNGLPDSTYNTYKCSLLVNKEDYSFWDLKKASCFAILSLLKEMIISNYDEVYLYERDDIRGIIYVTHNHGENKSEWVIFVIYSANDLNTHYTLQIEIKNLNEAYAIINSAEFI